MCFKIERVTENFNIYFKSVKAAAGDIFYAARPEYSQSSAVDEMRLKIEIMNIVKAQAERIRMLKRQLDDIYNNIQHLAEDV